jgi:hypothetical protein
MTDTNITGGGPRRFRVRDATVEALQWTGANTTEVIDWILAAGKQTARWHDAGDYMRSDGSTVHHEQRIRISTRVGTMWAEVGDWVVLWVDGCHYPCVADGFVEGFEELPDPADDELDNRTSGPVHTYFELTYANYLVKARALLQSMPVVWQDRFVACLQELDQAFAHVEQAPGYQVTAGKWVYANECDDRMLKAAGAEAYWVDEEGETIPESALADDAVFDKAQRRYAWRGDEVDESQRIFVPGPEPVPHYRHAYVEPATAAAAP